MVMTHWYNSFGKLALSGRAEDACAFYSFNVTSMYLILFVSSFF